MTSVGFVVGLLHRFTKAKGVGVGEIIKDGRVDNRFVPGALLISLLSLIGGFSVGPVLPTGMLAGGLATWVSDKRKLSEEIRRSNVVSSIYHCCRIGLHQRRQRYIIVSRSLLR
jgi:H+/Cl- antiporter ClcA